MEGQVVITARGEARLREGHLWIYRTDIAEAQAAGGDIVRVLAPRGRPAGKALFSDRSQIALRMLTGEDEAIDRAFWRRRLESALAFRQTLAISATAYRLVHGEGDLLPSLIVDRYGDYLVVQALSQAIERRLPELAGLLDELVRPAGILARNDSRVRVLEGLDQTVAVLSGEVPPATVVREGDIEHEVDLWKGQKTGLFLDQRETRDATVGYAAGEALDCFSYNGSFALRMASRCVHVVAVEVSEEAVARIRANADRNRCSNLEVRAANVFDELRQLERRGQRFDTIVLDPPAFAKHRGALAGALAGYKEINLRALRLLRPGGTLVTCSCSYHVDEATFGEVVFGAALDAGVQVSVVEKRMQGRDHPVLLGVPETYYLKCLILRRLG